MKAKVSKDMLQSMYNAAQAVSAREMTVVCSAGGWEMKLIDPAHVAMVSAIITADKFADYDMEDCRMCMPLDKLKTALSVMDKDIDLEFKDGRITMKSGSIRRSFASDRADELPKIPAFRKNDPIEVSTAVMRKAISAAADFSSAVMFLQDSEGFHVSSSGDTDDIQMDFDVPREEERKASYPLDYMQNILRAMPGEVNISYDSDYPVVIACTDPLDMEFILAPRIEQERSWTIRA